MKKALSFALLFLFAVGITALLLIPEEKKAPLILQTFSYSRSTLEQPLPYSTTQETETTFLEAQDTIVVEPNSIPEGGIDWLIAKTDDGNPKTQNDTYTITFDEQGNELSKVLVPYSTEIIEARPIVYSYGATVQEEAYFYSQRVTSYGADCIGCGSGGTPAGISLSTSSVRQSDGSWRDGITYDGYYLIAASSTLPLCTKVEISNHKFSGQGLTPGEPFVALVADRGGSIQGSIIDLFTGSEAYSSVRNNKRSNVKVKILEFGRKRGLGCQFSN